MPKISNLLYFDVEVVDGMILVVYEVVERVLDLRNVEIIPHKVDDCKS